MSFDVLVVGSPALGASESMQDVTITKNWESLLKNVQYWFASKNVPGMEKMEGGGLLLIFLLVGVWGGTDIIHWMLEGGHQVGLSISIFSTNGFWAVVTSTALMHHQWGYISDRGAKLRFDEEYP